MTILIPSRQLIQPGRQFELNTNVWEADGLVGWWPLGSYPDCRDMSLHGNHGTPVGGPVQAASGGRFGLEFDGADDYVDVANMPTLIDRTVSLWVRADASISAANNIVFSDGEGWQGISWQAPGALIVYHSIAGSALVSKTVSPANWHHVSMTVEEGINIHLYVDGILGGTTAIITTQSAFTLGIRNSDYAFPFPGLLNDVRIYNRALSSGEVSELHRTTRPGGYGRLAKPRVKYWVMGTTGNWSWLHHLQNSPYGISQ